MHKSERERAQVSENVSSAVLSNLPSGVLLFNPAGLVQQANEAAKSILGYASPLGLHARDLFRGVSTVRMATGEPEIVPKSAEPMTAILAGPPRAQPARRTATSMMNSPTPAFIITEAKRT